MKPGQSAAALRAELTARRDKLMKRFSEAVSKHDRPRMDTLCLRLAHATELIDTFDRASKPEGPRHLVSSLFLHETYRILTADSGEQLCLVTGAETGGMLVLDHRRDLEHEARSMVGVTAKPESMAKVLVELDRFGQRLLAHMHSHPGRGAGATEPSGIDQKFQRRLEQGGFEVLMAIFSRDGYVRFLRLDGEVEVKIHGSGVERVERGVYRLGHLD